jgi:hypothetical protein
MNSIAFIAFIAAARWKLFHRNHLAISSRNDAIWIIANQNGFPSAAVDV